MTGPKKLLVTKSSATNVVPGQRGTDTSESINKTHSEMVKFTSQDETETRVLGNLKKMYQNARGRQYGRYPAQTACKYRDRKRCNSKLNWMQ